MGSVQLILYHAREAEVMTDTKKSRTMNNQNFIDDLSKNAKYWIYLSATQKRIFPDEVKPSLWNSLRQKNAS